MASIDLSGLPFRTAGPRYRDFGGVQGAAAEQRVNRLGNRFGIELNLPPQPEEPDGRRLAQMLRLARGQGAITAFPQPGFDVGVPGAPVVNGTVAGGSTLPLRGLTPHYAVRFGQYLSVVHGGRRYLHSAAAAGEANGSGQLILTIHPMLRVSLADGDVVELAVPKIEGLLSGGNEVTWTIMTEPFVGFDKIVIEESE